MIEKALLGFVAFFVCLLVIAAFVWLIIKALGNIEDE